MKRILSILFMIVVLISGESYAIPFNGRTSPLKNVITNKVPLPAASAAHMRSV